ncbi:MAG: IS481 family transposase [Rhodospirillales bacterium]|nr:IS481 family transposase [Rhodospirillales bacterium]
MTMDAATKVARQRMSVLDLAAKLGNAAEACRRRGMDRSSFYEWRRRFQTHGLDGVKDLPPIAKSHPQTTPAEVQERIAALALEHPAYGCNRIEALLMLEGKRVSAITVQKILNERELGTRESRWLALERQNAERAIELTPEQVAFLEKQNSCFRERHVESSRPGELLCQDTFFVGTLKGIGKVYLHAVVDTYGSHAFGFLHVSKQPEAAVAVLHNDVLPFYRRLDLPVNAVLTDNGREFCGTDAHPYELYLAPNEIEHRRTRVRTPRTNGFVERFNGTVLAEFFRVTMREKVYATVEALQDDLDTWLVHYNTERPHLGYRNQGRGPWDTVKMFVSQEA